jgi:hypothetical protein
MSAPGHLTPLDALALDAISSPRPRVLADTFRAWRMPAGAKLISDPLDVSAATTLAEAVALAAPGCAHADHFTLLQTTVEGRQIEHVYYVKRRAPVWRADPDKFGAPRRYRDHAPQHRFSREVTPLAPVERWRWTPGGDVVGRDAGPGDGIVGEG